MSAHQMETITKAITQEHLTSTYLGKLERQKYRAVALAFFLTTMSFIWLIFLANNSSTDQTNAAMFSDAMCILTSLLGAFWSLRAAYYTYRTGPVVLDHRYCISWLLIGLALIANAAGRFYNGYLEYILGVELARPSGADVGFALFYILLMVGLLLLPFQLKKERLAIRIVIDSLVTILCLLGLSWDLLISPALSTAQPALPLQTFATLSNLLFDLLLILSVILFVRKRIEKELYFSLILCSLGVFFQIWADSGSLYLANLGHYASGSPGIDPFWFMSSLLIGLSSIYLSNAILRRAYLQSHQTMRTVPPSERQAYFPQRFLLIQSFLIYLPFAALMGITLYNQISRNDLLSHSLDILCVIVFVLIITRYILTAHENERLIREKEQRHIESDLLHKATASLTSILETDLLLSHIITIATLELGFDAAALVVIEEPERTVDEHSRLFIRASTRTMNRVVSWYATGQYIPFFVSLMEKKKEFTWEALPEHLPEGVQRWYRDQDMHTSFVVPLTYQSKIQGCLAISLREERLFSQHERSLIGAFAEAAANAIEHARLYELARANELFAQAMVNVAARLNSVVATGLGSGSELHHLICTEAANALSADIAILYGHNIYRQLLPLAVASDEPGFPVYAEEWPIISQEEHRELPIFSLSATLLEIDIHHSEPSLALIPYEDEAQPTVLSLPQGTVSSTLASTGHFSHVRQISSLLPAITRSSRVSLVPLRERGRFARTLQTMLQRLNIKTAILAPLVTHGTPVGLLVLARVYQPGTTRKRSFRSSDLPHAQDFAWQASIAFTNANLYQQLHNAHRQMQELDHLKDQFMVTASHELRTPLTAVQGYLELLNQYHADLEPEQQQEFLQKASRGCEELVLLLNNVMDASRLEIEAGIGNAHLENISVREVIEHVIDLIAPNITQEHRNIQVAVTPHLMVKADGTRLRQVIRNLSVNALKYSPPGTPLIFTARPVHPNNTAAIISVTDYGKGIKPCDHVRLFQRFVRLESDLNSTVRGSGLGLYISRRLVEAMHGRIWLESTGLPGRGTTFYIQLPIS